MYFRWQHTWMNSVLVAVLMLAVVSAAIAVPISRAEGTPEVDLADAPDAFMPGAGIAAALIGKANVDLAIMGDPTLRLERVDLPVGSTLPTHTSTVSEILYVETGSVAIADGFGFTTQTQAGQQLIFNPGTAYDLQQAGDEAARVLRVRVAAINEPLLDNANAGQEIGESGATPIIAEPTIITIIDHRLTDAPSPNATYYLARVALTPGAETGEQSHDGALGIYVASGALTALSPSGATGTLNTGASAVLPANVPLIGSNQGADDAVVFLVGLGTQGDPLIVEITPTPVPTIPPTPTATATPEPTATATPEPTPTVPPTATPMPSPTPLPTSIPTPPPPPLTQPDSILQIGETWHTEAADLQVAVTGVGDTLRLTFTYSNISNSRLDFVVPATVISIVDDTQSTWKVDTAATSTINLDEGRRVILDPGDSLEWRVIATVSGTPVQSHVANVFITIHDFGDVAVSRWGFTLYEGKTLSLPPDATNPLGNEDLIISTVTSESDSSISTQNQIPDELAGTWRGMISQKNPDAGWTITITLDSGDIGQVVGSYQSSSHECGGDLILTKRFKSSVELSISTDSSHASCWTVGKLALTAEPTGKLTLSWDGRSSTGDWTTAAATLVRID